MAKIRNPLTYMGGGSPTPPTPVEEKDINFYDYDGTLVESWTLAELPNKTELPANPSHTGLVAQGWNWTLAQLQAENAQMDVGQMYTTTDGKTHVFVDVDADHLTPNLAIGLNGTAIIDWGDGSATTTLSGSSVDTGQNSFHTYTTAGSYEVTIEVTNGSLAKIRGNNNYIGFLWKGQATQSSVIALNRAYAQQIKKIFVGDRITIASLNWAVNLEAISIPSTASFSSSSNGQGTFYNCHSLKAVVVPTNAFSSGISQLFMNCYGLQKVCFSAGISLQNCAEAFCDCSSLENVKLPSSAMTALPVLAFSGCASMRSFVFPPNTVSTNGNVFASCRNLQNVAYPSNINSVTGDYTNAGSLTTLDFTACSAVPSLTGSAVFSTQASEGFMIKVPASLEATWKTTSNWTNYAQYIVGV